MPVFNGSSVLGYQRVVYKEDASSSLVRILLDPQYDQRPDKVGYYYLLVATDGDFEKYVFDSGLLYRPGLAVATPERLLLVGKRVTIWVNWDVPNVNWSVTT